MEIIRSATGEFSKFTRSTQVKDHLRAQGFEIVTFHHHDLTISPVELGELDFLLNRFAEFRLGVNLMKLWKV